MSAYDKAEEAWLTQDILTTLANVKINPSAHSVTSTTTHTGDAKFPEWFYPVNELFLTEKEDPSVQRESVQLVGDQVPGALRATAKLSQVVYGMDRIFTQHFTETPQAGLWLQTMRSVLRLVDDENRSRVAIPHRWFHVESGQSDDHVLASWNGGYPYIANFLARYDTVVYAQAMASSLGALSAHLNDTGPGGLLALGTNDLAEFSPEHPRRLFARLQLLTRDNRYTLLKLVRNGVLMRGLTGRDQNPAQLRFHRRMRMGLEQKFADVEHAFVRDFVHLMKHYLAEYDIAPNTLDEYSTPVLVLLRPSSAYQLDHSGAVTSPAGSTRPFSGVYAALVCTVSAIYQFIGNSKHSKKGSNISDLHLKAQLYATFLDSVVMRRPAMLSRMVHLPHNFVRGNLLNLTLEPFSDHTAHIYACYRADAIVNTLAYGYVFAAWLTESGESEGQAKQMVSELRDCNDRLGELCVSMREYLLEEGDQDFSSPSPQELEDFTQAIDTTAYDVFNVVWRALQRVPGILPPQYQGYEFSKEFFVWLRTLPTEPVSSQGFSAKTFPDARSRRAVAPLTEDISEPTSTPLRSQPVVAVREAHETSAIAAEASLVEAEEEQEAETDADIGEDPDRPVAIGECITFAGKHPATGNNVYVASIEAVKEWHNNKNFVGARALAREGNLPEEAFVLFHREVVRLSKDFVITGSAIPEDMTPRAKDVRRFVGLLERAEKRLKSGAVVMVCREGRNRSAAAALAVLKRSTPNRTLEEVDEMMYRNREQSLEGLGIPAADIKKVLTRGNHMNYYVNQATRHAALPTGV